MKCILQDINNALTVFIQENSQKQTLLRKKVKYFFKLMVAAADGKMKAVI